MDDIKYHPLVDADPEGIVRVPMFCTTDFKGMKHHQFYLEECIPHRFRLHSAEDRTREEAQSGKIRCPYCGQVLQSISSSNGGTVHGLYVCPKC